MAKIDDNLLHVYAKNREEWRAWLERNHNLTAPIWLVYYKKGSGMPTVSYEEAVEEALCFGWIDSKANLVDAMRFKQVFSPRKPKSVWSKLNKSRVERLISEGRMTEAGLVKIEAAKQDGSWNALDDFEALIVPSDLQAALDANSTAHAHFYAFSLSSKKFVLTWIGTAKRPETRSKRIETTVEMAALNRVANSLQRPAPARKFVTKPEAERGSHEDN